MLIVVFGPPQLSLTPIHQFGGGCILQHAEEELEADGPERQILVMKVWTRKVIAAVDKVWRVFDCRGRGGGGYWHQQSTEWWSCFYFLVVVLWRRFDNKTSVVCDLCICL